MRIWKAVMNLVCAFTPIDSEDRSDLLNDLKKDYESIQFSDESIKKDPSIARKPEYQFKKWAEKSYVRLFIAVLYIISFRYIKHWTLTAGVLSREEEEGLAERRAQLDSTADSKF